MSDTQEQRILAHLKSGKSLTPLEALTRYGSLRLAARVASLRDCGYAIITERESKGGKCYARYRMGDSQ